MQVEWAEILPEERESVRFIDSHVHLCEYPDTTQIIALARENETLLLSSAVDRKTSDVTLTLARQNRGSVLAFVGVHPSEAERETELGWFAQAVGEAAGAGEVGLDPKYSSIAEKSVQRNAFVAQLEKTEIAAKPVQIHSRGAEAECLEILSGFTMRSVLMHWFEGEKLLDVVNQRGYFVSFGPALLYSKRLQRMALSVERESVLTETDGPVSFTQLRDSQGPALVPSVIFRLSQLWGLGFEEARELTCRNGIRYLAQSGKVNHPKLTGKHKFG